MSLGMALRELISGAAHNKNKGGARTLPFGNPARNTRSLLSVSFTSTLTLLSRSHCHSHLTMQRGRPSSSSRTRSRRWSTTS